MDGFTDGQWEGSRSRSSTCTGSAAALAAEEATVADHKRLMLGDMLASLHRRLRRLASGLETGRLAATTANSPGYGLRVPELATDATSAVPKAAQAAFRDYSLARTQSKRKRRGHATEGYDALTPPPPQERKGRENEVLRGADAECACLRGVHGQWGEKSTSAG